MVQIGHYESVIMITEKGQSSSCEDSLLIWSEQQQK